MDKILNNFASASSIKPVLQHAYLNKGYAYATDSYKAIKIKLLALPEEFHPLIEAKDKIVPVDNLESKGLKDMQFPEIDRVFRDTSKDHRITVDFEYLEQVMNSFKRLHKLAKDKGHRKVEIFIDEGHVNPVVFRTKYAEALLMPIYND